MSVLLWVAVAIGAWCASSVVAALLLGGFLRRRHEATDPEGALRPLDTGPLSLWVGGFPEVPDTPEELFVTRTADPELGLPAPRPAGDSVTARLRASRGA